MRRESFSYEVLCELEFTKEEIKLLLETSKSHYEFSCRKEGQHGGFIYGWSNHFIEANSSLPVRASFHQIDTACKILEMAQTEQGQTLYWQLRHQLHEINQEYEILRNWRGANGKSKEGSERRSSAETKG